MHIELTFGLFGVIVGTFVFLSLAYKGGLKLLDWRAPEKAETIRKNKDLISLGVLVVLLVLLVLVPHILVKVDSGEAGVLWQRFGGGTKLGEPYEEGTVLVLPWDHLTIYSTRFQNMEVPVEAVTSEGLKIKLNLVVRYRPIKPELPLLHKLVGEHYSDVMIKPEVGASSRLVVSSYTAEEVYGELRQEVQKKIFDGTNTALRLNERQLLKDLGINEMSKFLHLEDVLLRDVLLPKRVNEAIVNKVNQKYLDEEYVTRIEVAKKEAIRKQTEAEGIAAFQETVAGGISETYLRWRGIEATLELAKSNNAKVVVIGGGDDGLPLILNTESSLSPNVNAQLSSAAKQPEQAQKSDTAKVAAPVQTINPETLFSVDPTTKQLEINASALTPVLTDKKQPNS